MKKILNLLATTLFLVLSCSVFSQRRPPLRTPAKVIVAPSKPMKKARKGTWEILGSKKVNLTLDSDQLFVTAYEGAFNKVKFQVLKAPVHVKTIELVFANGETKKISIDRDFETGAISKIIDLPGNQRIIQKINFQYRTINNGSGKATVTVWGMH